MSETMKKRYEDVSATLCAIHGLKYSHCLTREEAEAIESLLDDLMAERGKMKERIDHLEDVHLLITLSQMDSKELVQHLLFLEEGLAPFSEYNWRIERLREILNIPKEPK